MKIVGKKMSQIARFNFDFTMRDWEIGVHFDRLTFSIFQGQRHIFCNEKKLNISKFSLIKFLSEKN